MATTNEQELIYIAKKMMPSQFTTKVDDDTVILAFLNLVIAEINYTPPVTSFAVENLPDKSWKYIVAYGSQVYSILFLQGGYALDDFSYSDGGLSLNIDRHGKLTSSHQLAYTNYDKMIKNIKKIYTLKIQPRSVTTPQFNTIFAQYLGSIFPGSFPMRK